MNTANNSTGDFLYTRAGSFRQDNLGNLRNTGGFFLQGWPLDANGLLPGEPGNSNTTSSADLASLETVNVSNVNGIAATTTTVAIGANLTASEPIFIGPSDLTSALSVTATSDLGAAIAGLVDGDVFSLTNGTNTQVFEYDATPTAGTQEYSNLTELAALINATTGLTASIGGSASDARLTVLGDDPRQTLVLAEVTNTPGADLFGSVGTVATTYDPTDSTKNMASGLISPDFSRAVRVFDAQGTGHDLQVAFLKVAENDWAVEVHASPASDVTSIAPLVDGQIGSGTITFNGDATLNSVTSGLTSPIDAAWTNGSTAGAITFDWGTAGIIGTGKANGLSQFDGPYNVSFVAQNGSEVGQLNGVLIDDAGFAIASFSNGETKRLYKIPIVTFADSANLGARNGNVFSQTDKSGEFNLREANQGGAGQIAPSALEAANVDLGKEFTDMIVTQRAFTASSRVITTVDEMLEERIRI